MFRQILCLDSNVAIIDAANFKMVVLFLCDILHIRNELRWLATEAFISENASDNDCMRST